MEALSLINALRNCFVSEKHIMTMNLALMIEAVTVGS
jgi:hypothetical protein